ncbi:hypothetical protein BLA29_001759, partial [Euroglyphus maynei]
MVSVSNGSIDMDLTPTDLKFLCWIPVGMDVLAMGILTKCSDEDTKWCKNNIGSQSRCEPLSKEKFKCQCPIGYQFDLKSKSCRRANIKRKEKICGTKVNEVIPQCFLYNLTQNMKYLPNNFPRIDQSLFKSGQSPIYYTGKSGSQIQIQEISLPKNSNEDICLRFRYFLSGQNARLNVTMVATDENEQNLFQINGIEMLTQTEKEISHYGKSMMSLSSKDMEKLCIKEMIGNRQMKRLESLSVLATLNDHSDDLTLIQILGVETQPIEQRISAEPWLYISRTKSGLKQWYNTSMVNENIANSDRWPLQFPNERWQNNELTNENDLQIISLSSQQTHTTGFAQLETQWIQQAINEQSTAKTVMTIKLNSMTPNYLHYVHIILFNQQRQPLYDMGTYRVFDKEEANDQKDKHDIIVLGETRVIPVEKLNIDNETLYKVAIKFHFDDPVHRSSSVKRPFLFEVQDFTFGDPCIQSKDGEDQKCYNLNEPPEQDLKIKCFREVSMDRSKIDYQCDCNFDDGAKGRDCHEKDYCKYRHLGKEDKINGQEYCKKDDAECHEGRFKDYKFLCTCNNESLWFKMDDRKCRPVQPCLLDVPGQLERRKCRDDDNNGKCLCECKMGYVEDPNDSNQCVVSDSDECNPNACPDKRMLCVKQGSNQLCKCPLGFRFDGQECKSDFCRFPSLNLCQQKCTPIEKQPYFQCECNPQYYTTMDVIDSATNITYTKCVLRNDVPKSCQQCTGANQLCSNDQCQCNEGFESKRSSSDQMECIIKDLKMACPQNRLHIDSEITNRTFCNCKGKDLTDWWQQSDNGSCTLVKTACDENEQGDLTCRRYGALCVLKSDHPDSFDCLCPHGYMFADKSQSKAGSLLINDKSSGCYPVCEIPYYGQICSAIGGRCNPIKLWPHLIKSAAKSTDYCDCLPGLFRVSNRNGDFCQQESDVTAYH